MPRSIGIGLGMSNARSSRATDYRTNLIAGFHFDQGADTGVIYEDTIGNASYNGTNGYPAGAPNSFQCTWVNSPQALSLPGDTNIAQWPIALADATKTFFLCYQHFENRNFQTPPCLRFCDNRGRIFLGDAGAETFSPAISPPKGAYVLGVRFGSQSNRRICYYTGGVETVCPLYKNPGTTTANDVGDCLTNAVGWAMGYWALGTGFHFDSKMKLHVMRCYSEEVSNSNMSLILAKMATEAAAQGVTVSDTDAQDVQIVIIGDSNTGGAYSYTGSASTDYEGTLAAEFRPLAKSNLKIHNLGTNGWRLDDYTGSTGVDAWLAGVVSSFAGKTVVLIRLGVNDAGAGDTSATIVSDMASLVTKCRTAGAHYVAAFSIQPATFGTNSAAKNTELQAANTAHASWGVDLYIDTTASVDIGYGTVGGASWVADGIHFNRTGNQKHAAYLVTAAPTIEAALSVTIL